MADINEEAIMRVLHVTNAYPTKEHPAFGIFIKEQIDSLVKAGIECDVFFVNAMQGGVKEYVAAFYKIKQMWKQYDIIHCHHTYTGFITKILAGVKKPVVVSFLSTSSGEVRRFRPLWRLAHELLLPRIEAFIVKNNREIKHKYLGREFYVPNGVDMELFKEIDRNESYKKLELEPAQYILFVSARGVNRKEKRHDLYKQVIRLLRQRHGDSIKELVVTKTERKLMPYYYNAASMLLLTSDYEGSPNCVKEALACNIPVVSTKVGDVVNILEEVEGCFVTEERNPEILAHLAEKALVNQRVNGRETLFQKGIDSISIAKNIDTIYRKVLVK